MRFLYTVFFIFSIFTQSSLAVNFDIWTDSLSHSLRVINAGLTEADVLLLGLEYRLDDDWHIYFKDPGDVGLGTNVKLDGVNILAYFLHWPQHEVLISNIEGKELISNVYYKNVLIPIKVPLRDSTLSTQIKLSLNYALCRDICIPQRQEILVDWSGGSVNHQNKVLIESWLSK